MRTSFADAALRGLADAPVRKTIMKTTDMHWMDNPAARRASFALPEAAATTFQAAEDAHAFHESLPGYRPTPLFALDALARVLDLRSVWVKDESQRLGLGAFKVLGASYAVARQLTARFGLDRTASLSQLAARLRDGHPRLTLATATDGNHGHGLAWVARQLGAQAVVYVPSGCAQHRYDRIAAEGAEVVRTNLTYDRAVDLAAAQSEEHGWLLVQDTAWEGYEQIPDWIMQGYLTVCHESAAQWQAANAAMPTHVFVQAGVGSFAASVQSYLSARWGEHRPRTIVMEPLAAACLLRSAQSSDGEVKTVEGGLDTIMAGLACGRPNPRAWGILWSQADLFLACSDEYAARGMRILASPAGIDSRVIAGESGAVGIGVLSALRLNSRWQDLARAIGLDSDSRVLVFNTEGDTDPENYRRVVWDGAHAFGAQDRSSAAPAVRRSKARARIQP